MTSTFDEERLRTFYDRLFPFEQMHEWLSYGDAGTFLRREFSFTLANDVYIRYLTFRDAESFRQQVKKDNPHKIDIGAVYTVAAQDHIAVSANKFRPVQRELVFDVDLTDYKDAQVGMTDADALWAKGSWGFMATAIKVVDRALREDFGYKHLLWVFSGRRGVHCWVCDEHARALEDHERAAVVDYLTIIVGGRQDGAERVQVTYPLHPSIERALDICREAFAGTMLDDDNQALLQTEDGWKVLWDMLPECDTSAALKRECEAQWKKQPAASSARWNTFESHLKKWVKSEKDDDAKKGLLLALDKIVLALTYPRLDEAVSTHRNHLLKSPFVVHPKTGKVCVPIFDVANCHLFDPDAVPNLATLIEEIDDGARRPLSGGEVGAADNNNPPESKRSKLARPVTKLDAFVRRFEHDFLRPMREQREQAEEAAAKATRAAKKDLGERQAAATGAW